MQQFSKGFTLIELLVVLVITSLTTALLITGLNSTWNNFDKLLAKNLSENAARLPATWFENSIRGAVLYHPEKVYFKGNNTQISFISIASPNASNRAPASVHWKLETTNVGSTLSFAPSSKHTEIRVYNFEYPARFEYLVSGNWVDTFEDKPGSLPSAARILHNNQIWSFATVHRPVEADIPAELPITGKYEF